MNVFHLLLFLFLAAGGFSLAALLLRLPPGGGKKAFSALREKVTLKQRLMLSIVAPLSGPVSRVLPLPARFEAALAFDLARTGIPYKPREYYARGLTTALLSGIFPLLGILLGNTFLRLCGAVIPVLVFRAMTTVHKDILKNRKKRVKRDTPHFIRSILYRFLQTGGDMPPAGVDLISVFEDYIRVAPASLADDIKLLVTDMKSRSVETGLHNFADRMGLPEVRHMVSALVGIYQGQDQTSALLTLSQEADTAAREHHRRELYRQPGRIRMATIPIVVIAMITLLYVLLMHIYMSSQSLF